MPKKLVSTVLFVIAFVVIGGIIVYQSLNAPNPLPRDSENNTFNILYRYGTGAKNELNTFNNSFTKDLAINGTITTTLTLSKEELGALQQKINDLYLAACPNDFPLYTNYRVDPQCEWYIKIQDGDQIKEISWNSNSAIESNIQEKLDQLNTYITDLIEQKPEYKTLPDAEGGYC